MKSKQASMKLNPPRPSPREAGFHREAISSTAGGFIPPKADLVEKSTATAVPFSLASMSGIDILTRNINSGIIKSRKA